MFSTIHEWSIWKFGIHKSWITFVNVETTSYIFDSMCTLKLNLTLKCMLNHWHWVHSPLWFNNHHDSFPNFVLHMYCNEIPEDFFLNIHIFQQNFLSWGYLLLLEVLPMVSSLNGLEHNHYSLMDKCGWKAYQTLQLSKLGNFAMNNTSLVIFCGFSVIQHVGEWSWAG